MTSMIDNRSHIDIYSKHKVKKYSKKVAIPFYCCSIIIIDVEKRAKLSSHTHFKPNSIELSIQYSTMQYSTIHMIMRRTQILVRFFLFFFVIFSSLLFHTK